MAPFFSFPLNRLAVILSVCLFISSCCVYFFFRTRTGKMKHPVTAYIVIISFMVQASILVLPNTDVKFVGRFQLFIAAIFFYVSDILLATLKFAPVAPL